MANLNCSVENCVYNEENLCSKGDIQVGGARANYSEETCCESFKERSANSFRNSLSHPSRTISIDCEATKCVYNEDCKCHAEHVDIRGCGASDCRETACGTFKER